MFNLLEDYIKKTAAIDAPSLALVFSKFKLIKTKRNQILVNHGEVCKYHYFINKGAIRVYTITADGTETTRFFAFEGGFGTALPSLIDQQPALEYLQTIEKAELLAISRKDFYELVDTVPAFAIIYRNILEFAFIIAQQRIYGFQGFDAKQKVLWIKKNQPHLLLRVSNKMVASYLGVSPSTLSRIKAKL